MGLPSAFKVRNAGLFRLYRKVDVDAGNRGSKLIELRGLSTYTVDNWSDTAKMLSSLVTCFRVLPL